MSPPAALLETHQGSILAGVEGRKDSTPAFYSASAGHPLTKAQLGAMRFIQGFIYAKGWSPTYRTIAAGLGLRSTSGIHRLVKALVERGYISQEWVAHDYYEIIILRPVPVPRIGKTPLQFIPMEDI